MTKIFGFRLPTPEWCTRDVDDCRLKRLEKSSKRSVHIRATDWYQPIFGLGLRSGPADLLHSHQCLHWSRALVLASELVRLFLDVPCKSFGPLWQSWCIEAIWSINSGVSQFHISFRPVLYKTVFECFKASWQGCKVPQGQANGFLIFCVAKATGHMNVYCTALEPFIVHGRTHRTASKNGSEQWNALISTLPPPALLCETVRIPRKEMDSEACFGKDILFQLWHNCWKIIVIGSQVLGKWVLIVYTTQLWVVHCQGLVQHSSILLSSLGRRGAGSAWNPLAWISDSRFSMPF